MAWTVDLKNDGTETRTESLSEAVGMAENSLIGRNDRNMDPVVLRSEGGTVTIILEPESVDPLESGPSPF